MSDIIKEFKEITKKTKLITELKTLMEIKETIEIKIESAERKLVKLDMEEAKNGLERKKT